MLFYFSFSYSQRILISDVESCPVASKLKYESTQDRLLYDTLMECMNAFEGTQECLQLIKEIYDPPKSCDSQGKAMTDTMPVTQLISETLGAIFGINDFVELALTANYFDETTLQQHRDSLAFYQDLNFDELVKMKVCDCNYMHRGIIQSISLITHMCVLMLHRYYMIKIENGEIYTNDRKGFINGIQKYLKYDSLYLDTILELRRDVIPFNISTKDIFDSSYSVQDVLIFINRNVMPGDIVFLNYSLVEIYAEIEEKLKAQKNVESASIEDILDTIVKNSILYKVWTAHQNGIIKHGSLRIILREETKFEKFWIVDKRCDTFDKWQYFVLAREHRIAQIRDAIKRIFYANCT